MDTCRYLSTSRIARICQVTPVTVGNWIRSGKLKASRVGTGNYRVSPKDLTDFLREANMSIPTDFSDRRPRVLIVSSEPRTLRQINDILNASGHYEVDTAGDCLGAGAKIVQTEPDLVILKLPMSGIDQHSCGRIRQMAIWNRIKLLVIADSVKAATVARSYGVEADKYLAEDCVAERLGSTLSGLLSQYVSPALGPVLDGLR